MQDCNVMQHIVIKELYFQESDEFHTPDLIWCRWGGQTQLMTGRLKQTAFSLYC